MTGVPNHKLKTAFLICAGTLLLVEAAGASPAIELTLVASGLAGPVAVTHAGDQSGRLFITLQAGMVVIHDGVQVRSTPFLDISTRVSCCSERGLLSVAFHPNYKNNGLFYVDYTDTLGDTVVARYNVSLDPNLADPGSEVILLKISQPFANHNGGQLQFGPDGYLYIGTGDGGSAGDPLDNGQKLDTLLGKILRIDVDGGAPYAIPPGNPFVSTSGARPEIWARGLRNPWRFSFDRATGDLFIADVGQASWEEINVQAASSAGGENYGWRLMEGMHCYNPASNCNDGTLTLPVLEYSHVLGCSVTGGYRYRGVGIPQLYGSYLYGDYCQGRIWAATGGGGSWTSVELIDTNLLISSFGEDESGEIYVVHYSSTAGALYRVAAPPASLSIGLGQGSGGWVETVAGPAPHGHLDWEAVAWDGYNGSEGETRPAMCDLDGDAKYELVIGLGPFPTSGGWLEVKDDRDTGYAHLAWVRISWPAYNAANGETFPACGDLDGDGLDEIAVGLGNGGEGWLQIFDDARAGFLPLQGTPAANGWVQLAWPAYNGPLGKVRPAIGNLDGDPVDELVLAVGSGGAGWVQILDDAKSGFVPLAGTPTSNGWVQSWWPGYNAGSGEIRPAVCDLNGDGRGELAMGLGRFSGGWVQLFDSAKGFSPLAGTPSANGWVRVSWPVYAGAGGGTHPTCRNVDGDVREELVLGLDSYPANGGWVEVKDDLAAGLAHISWARVQWPAYNSANGETRPVAGR